MDYQKLFDYMAKEHNVTLLESEMQHIVNLCEDINSEQKSGFNQKTKTIDFSEMQRAVFVAAIEKYGDKHQIIKATEELCELAQILCKHLNTGCDYMLIMSELVDVCVMLNQLMVIFSQKTCDYEMELMINEQIEYKIQRLYDRVSIY